MQGLICLMIAQQKYKQMISALRDAEKHHKALQKTIAAIQHKEQKLLTKEEHDAILQLGITARELAKKLFGEVSDAP